METEKKYKTIYEILGRTKSQKFVCSGWWSAPNGALQEFVEQYPRFTGRATLFKKQVEDMGDQLLISDMANRGEELVMFASTKEIKTFINNNQ